MDIRCLLPYLPYPALPHHHLPALPSAARPAAHARRCGRRCCARTAAAHAHHRAPCGIATAAQRLLPTWPLPVTAAACLRAQTTRALTYASYHYTTLPVDALLLPRSLPASPHPTPATTAHCAGTGATLPPAYRFCRAVIPCCTPGNITHSAARLPAARATRIYSAPHLPED